MIIISLNKHLYMSSNIIEGVIRCLAKVKLTLAILAVGKIFIVINGQIINKKYGRLVTLVSGMEESAVDQSDVYCLLHGFQAILTAEFYFTK